MLCTRRLGELPSLFRETAAVTKATGPSHMRIAARHADWRLAPGATCAQANSTASREVAGRHIEECGFEERLPECQQSGDMVDGGFDRVLQLGLGSRGSAETLKDGLSSRIKQEVSQLVPCREVCAYLSRPACVDNDEIVAPALTGLRVIYK
jgi:hypothetical protein